MRAKSVVCGGLMYFAQMSFALLLNCVSRFFIASSVADRIGALLRRDQALIIFDRKFRVDRQPDRRAVFIAGQLDRELDLLPAAFARLDVARELFGASTCSSSAPSCTSPQPPRVLTFVSTRCSPPTSLASCCIAPSPDALCSSRSLTSLNDSPSRLLQRALQLFVHRRSHLVDLPRVVLLQLL